MSDEPHIDPVRRLAIRDMLVEVAATDSATARRHRLSPRSLVILVAGALLAVAGTGGAAYALVNSPLIYSPSATPGGPATLAPVPHWPRNASGQTYGSQGSSPIAPDLISASTTTGLTGYIYSKDLIAAEGPMPTSPAQAGTWNKTHPPHVVYIPVYKSDGKTQIGLFRDGG
jgi:hypothetical protein